MNKLNETIKADLTALAKKHGLSYDSLSALIGAEWERQNRLEDIKYILENHYEDVVINDNNLAMIYDRLEAHEDAEYGVWDNIQSAISWCYDDLEKIAEGGN